MEPEDEKFLLEIQNLEKIHPEYDLNYEKLGNTIEIFKEKELRLESNIPLFLFYDTFSKIDR